MSFAHYIERQNLEDRVEWSPDALRVMDRLSEPCRLPPKPEGSVAELPRPDSGTAKLADVLPVAEPPRRVVVETAYRLRVATTRPGGVLDVIG